MGSDTALLPGLHQVQHKMPTTHLPRPSFELDGNEEDITPSFPNRGGPPPNPRSMTEEELAERQQGVALGRVSEVGMIMTR